MLAIVAAFDHEIALVRKRMDVDTRISLKPGLIEHGHLGALEVVLIRTGMGKAAMAKVMGFACEYYSITSILLIGYAGGTRPQLLLGDAVVPEQLVDSESRETWATTGALSELAVRVAEELQLRVHRGASVCVPMTIETPHEKAYLGTQFEALSIEMEGSALAKLAKDHNIPFAMVRAIVDPLDMALPHFPNSIVAKGVIRPLMMASYLLRNPKILLQLPKLHYSSTRARETVTDICLGVCTRWGG